MYRHAFFKRLTGLVLLLAVLVNVLALPEGALAAGERYGRVAYDKVYFRKAPSTEAGKGYWCFLNTHWVVRILGTRYNEFGSWYEIESVIPGDLSTLYTGYMMQRYVTEMTEDEVKAWLANPVQPGTGMPSATRTPSPTAAPAEENDSPFSSGDTGFINANNVYLRKKADTASDSLALLPYGWVLYCVDKVYVNGSVWYAVEGPIPSDTKTLYSGYVDARYITLGTVSDPVTQAPATQVPETQAPATKTPETPSATEGTLPDFSTGDEAYISAESVYFRKSPSREADYWALLPYGWTLYCLDRTFNGNSVWYQAEGTLPSDPGTLYTGYVDSRYLTLGAAPATAAPSVPTDFPPTQAPTQAPSDVQSRYITVMNTFFQESADYLSATIALLPVNWPVTVLETLTENGVVWYAVSCAIPKDPGGVYYGYIEPKFVSSGETPSTPAPVVTAWPTQPSLVTETPAATTQAPYVTNTPAVPDLPELLEPNAYVDTEQVRFRINASSSSDFYGILPLDWPLEVLSSTNAEGITWYRVRTVLPSRLNTVYTGYIMAGYVTLLSPATTEPAVTVPPTPAVTATVPSSPTNTPSESALSNYAVVMVDGLNVRQSTNVFSATITALYAGQIVTVVDASGAMPLIRTDNVQGYVLSSGLRYLTWEEYLDITDPSTPVPATPTPTAAPTVTPTPSPTPQPENPDVTPTARPSETGTPNVMLGWVRITLPVVNLRATPGGNTLTPTDEDRIPLSTYLRYYQQPVYYQGYYWTYVEYNGMFGYIRGDCFEYVEEGPSPTPHEIIHTEDSLGTVQITQEAVNFRASPDGRVIGIIHYLTRVPYFAEPITKNGYGWLRIYYNGQYGYIRSDCYGEISPGPFIPTPTPSTLSMIGFVAPRDSVMTVYRNPGGSVLSTLTSYSICPYYETVLYNNVLWYRVYSYRIQRYGYISSEQAVVVNIYGDDSGTSTPVPSSATVTPSASPTASPTPSPTPRLFETGYVVTTSDAVYIRLEPSTASSALTRVSYRNTVLPTTDQPVSNGGITWYPVRYNGIDGYIHGGYCTLLNDWQIAVYLSTGVVPTLPPEGTNTPSPTAAQTPTATPSPVTPQPTVHVPSTYRLLSLNDSGSDVLAVQQVLSSIDYLDPNDVNGTFLSSTQTAVIQYQYDHSLDVTGIVNEETWNLLFNLSSPVSDATANPGSSVSVSLNPVELSDWYTGEIQSVWAPGVTAVITDVYTGISFQAKRWAGSRHADVEPLTQADTAAMCRIYGVSYAYEIDTLNQSIESWRRRPVWVTVGSRTFAASMYGIPHNAEEGNTITDNNYPGQFCVHFVNSTTHSSTVPDTANQNNAYFGHQEAIMYAYTHSVSGNK